MSIHTTHRKQQTVSNSIITISERRSLSALSSCCWWKRVCCFTTVVGVVCLLVLRSPTTCHASRNNHDIGRRLVIEDKNKNTNNHNDLVVPDPNSAGGNSDSRMSIANMTCGVFKQPLNHFVPRGRSPAYEERYCTYYGYAHNKGGEDEPNNKNTTAKDNNDKSPIFFYTGNESPLEQYINQTGLMWELAPKFGARIVFAEHRYEGESLPPKTLSKDCLGYSSTIQALADYARLLEEELNPNQMAPVIVFGGSYGGMLSAWMRMKYPHLVAGAIAASAPIGAFPQSANSKIDYSARVLAQGMDKPYPPTSSQDGGREEEFSRRRKGRRLQGTGASLPSKAAEIPLKTNNEERMAHGEKINYCSDNLLAAWPLIAWLAQQDDDEQSANLLQKSFSMCDPLPDKNGDPLLHWAQGVWFDLAEGSFPYPSSYIPFALLHKKVDLPPWPTQDACWKSSELHKDWGVRFRGSKEDVRYVIDYGDSGVSLGVDWDSVKLVDKNSTSSSKESTIKDSTDVVGLLTSVRDAVSIWYNITKDVPCYNISQSAPNVGRMASRRRKTTLPFPLSSSSFSSLSMVDGSNSFYDPSIRTERLDYSRFDPAKECREAMIEQGSWGTLCCNDEMNLVITEARGMGNDFFWPPSHPKSVRTYQDMVSNATFEPCPDPYEIYGYSREPYEPLSKRLGTYYGGISMKGHSNIVFSNGLLDPWSAGGVYKDNNNPNVSQESSFEEDKATIQNITENDVIALIIPFGGHHTDLMYSSDSDPRCVTEGRNVEEAFIARWIREW